MKVRRRSFTLGNVCRTIIGQGKKPINKQTHKQRFHGIVPGLYRDCPGTLPAFPEISWEFCLCVSLFPQEKGKHINNLTPTHFRDNPAKLFMFIGFFSPDTKLGQAHVRSPAKLSAVYQTFPLWCLQDFLALSCLLR